ncbi:MAG: MBL fold metallo-hydrolase [Flavobacteriaceae bacterium]
MNSPRHQKTRQEGLSETPAVPEVPDFGELAVIEPGLMMTRMPHPDQPHELNIYFIEDTDGWTLVDTGCGEEAQGIWEKMLAGPLRDIRINRVLVTHFHADHIGLAGWLRKRLDAPVLMTRDCQESLAFDMRPYDDDQRAFVKHFCESHGYGPGAQERLLTQPSEFYADVHPLPEDLVHLPLAGQLSFARHDFEILPLSGHAPNLITLRETSGRIYMSCDQVMGALSPVLFVNVVEPEYDAAADYMRSLDLIEKQISPEAFVLPGHFSPFTGLHDAVKRARDRQNSRAERVLKACSEAELQLADVSAVLYGSKPEGRESWFFVSEALTNVNRLIGEGKLAWHDRGAARVLRAL